MLKELQESALPAAEGGRGDRIALAYERLRDLIVWGKLAPGARIVEMDVAARLGVSRTPVRAALQRLEQEGYVYGSGGAQSRMCVAPLTQDDARELFAIVAEVEGLAASWAAGRPAEERADLVQLLREVNDQLATVGTAPTPDRPRSFELDRLFHNAIVAAGAGVRLAALHEGLKPQIERYGRIYANALILQITRSVDEHKQMIAAIEAGDCRLAGDCMRHNWYNAFERLAHEINAMGERGRS